MLIIPQIPTHYRNKVYVCFGRHEFSQFSSDNKDTVFNPSTDMFSVTINGISCPVRACRVSSLPLNRPWPGRQRSISQSEETGYISFYSDEEVVLTVTRKKSFKSATISPISSGIKTEISGNNVSFKLNTQGNYVLKFDGIAYPLHIFFNKPKDYPESKNATHYFGPGIHFPGNINLQDNDSVYIDKEAIVFGSINGENVKNVRIYGGGVLDNSTEERVVENVYENMTKGCFHIFNCEDIRLEDIILTNSCTWVAAIFDSKNIVLDNVKIVGQWRYNSDGIDIVNSQNIMIKDCFIRSFDDSVSIKGIYQFKGSLENIVIDNCVMWTDWGFSCEIGVEAQAEAYNNIVFKNCDIIRTATAALSVDNGNDAKMTNILFENNNIEMSAYNKTPITQYSDNQVYNPEIPTQLPIFLFIRTSRFAIRDVESLGMDTVVRKKCDPGVIKGVLVKDSKIWTDAPFKPQIFVSAVEGSLIEDIKIEGLLVNDEKQKSLKNIELVLKNFGEIQFVE